MFRVRFFVTTPLLQGFGWDFGNQALFQWCRCGVSTTSHSCSDFCAAALTLFRVLELTPILLHCIFVEWTATAHSFGVFGFWGTWGTSHSFHSCFVFLMVLLVFELVLRNTS